jgi:hypothetical protein
MFIGLIHEKLHLKPMLKNTIKKTLFKTLFKTPLKTPVKTLFKILLKIRMFCSPVHAWGRAHPAADLPASRSTSLKMADDLYVKG